MLNIVLYEPEIPQNTGNIMRTCVALGIKLHLIEPLGFSLEAKYVKRASANYMKDLNYTVYPNWDAFMKENANKGKFFYSTRYGKKPHSDFDYKAIKEEIFLVFGKESAGIPKMILKNNLETCFRIPMVASARSLNLSNCVMTVAYEVMRQLGYPGLSFSETQKGADFLENFVEDATDV